MTLQVDPGGARPTSCLARRDEHRCRGVMPTLLTSASEPPKRHSRVGLDQPPRLLPVRRRGDAGHRLPARCDDRVGRPSWRFADVVDDEPRARAASAWAWARREPLARSRSTIATRPSSVPLIPTSSVPPRASATMRFINSCAAREVLDQARRPGRWQRPRRRRALVEARAGSSIGAFAAITTWPRRARWLFFIARPSRHHVAPAHRRRARERQRVAGRRASAPRPPRLPVATGRLRTRCGTPSSTVVTTRVVDLGSGSAA